MVYNVSVPVILRTIVEEELHSIEQNIHRTTRTSDVVNFIKAKNPKLKKEIGLNLNHILSTEEEKFTLFGEIIRKEFASEIRKLKKFCDLFEYTLLSLNK